MNFLFAPGAPLAAPEARSRVAPAPRAHAGRFAETRRVRALRGAFRLVARVSPRMAALAGYALLARPPRSLQSHWQLALRGKAQSRRLRFGSGELAVYEWGAGPAVLMVHGWGSHALHMGRMVLPLVDAGFRVVSFDAPAHGASSGRSTDLVEFASAVAAVAASTGPVHCILAHSFGASMALYAHRDWGIGAGRIVAISSFDDCNWFIEAFGRHIGLSGAVLSDIRGMLVERYSGRINWSRMSVVDMLRHAGLPALVVHDQDDEEIAFAHGQSLAAASPQTQFHATRGHGHHRVVRSTAVIERVVQFVAA